MGEWVALNSLTPRGRPPIGAAHPRGQDKVPALHIPSGSEGCNSITEDVPRLCVRDEAAVRRLAPAPSISPPVSQSAPRARRRSAATSPCVSAPRPAPEPSASRGGGYSTPRPVSGRRGRHHATLFYRPPRAPPHLHHATEIRPAQAGGDGPPRTRVGAQRCSLGGRRRGAASARLNRGRRVATADACVGAARRVPTGRCAAARG